ncbi:Bug family tripartite tricarboxylate transporter substrate binding protein [Marinomonas balearica]|uniref:Tripartite-type tricarboxylate transporter receptor subunit TctC n=1 Tax=Marinomonas balearica TaxID=491947 RepID=A0A4R6M247_9GAMM|nr:tripartite tricarboxylate transporter substrate binding protein [Marinomonas balearica]TDO95317.1 tripartite-type tricarboxylate transporter receptor subunit TctC [Marinomonas balearica]
MTKPRFSLSLIAAIGLTVLSSTAAIAQNYPDHAIDVIVAFNPGGGTDVAARTIEPYIEKYLGEDLVIINKPGAGGEVGFSLLATGKKDGYTMGFINLPAMYSYSYERDTAYSPKSFTGVANLVYDPGVIVVRSDSTLKTLQDLVDYGTKNPGALPIGTSGSIGSSEHIAILGVEAATGAKFNHVPFGATAPLRTALLGGHIQVAAFNLSEATEYVKDGSMRLLGVMSDKRNAMSPDTPTFREQGVDVISGSSRGLAVSAGTDPKVVAILSAAVEKAVNDPEYLAKAKAAGVPVHYIGGADYDVFLSQVSASLDAAWAATPWSK